MLRYIFLVLLAMVAFTDMNTMKIPDRLLAAIAVLGVLAIPVFPELSPWERGTGMLCVSLPMFIITLIVPGGFGGGDIKLIAICGLFLGYKKIALAFAAAIMTAGVYCIWLLAIGKMEWKSKFAFGPFLCLGMMAVVLLE